MINGSVKNFSFSDECNVCSVDTTAVLTLNKTSEFVVISMQVGFALEVVVVSLSSAPRQCWHSAREEVEDWRSSFSGLESGPCDLVQL